MELEISVSLNGQEILPCEYDFADIDKISEYVEYILTKEYKSNKNPYITLLLTDNDEIQNINREYRGIDAPTDVISFAYHDSGDASDFNIGDIDSLGDLIISLPRIVSQASDYNHSPKREFYYVLTHGMLHLLGYDHMEEDDKKIMRQKEESILNDFGYTRDYE